MLARFNKQAPNKIGRCLTEIKAETAPKLQRNDTPAAITAAIVIVDPKTQWCPTLVAITGFPSETARSASGDNSNNTENCTLSLHAKESKAKE